jgi:ankyrin repeat protein
MHWVEALRFATWKHDFNVTKVLEKGAKIQTEDGRTPLLWVVEKGYEAVVKLLLEEGGQNHNSYEIVI